VDGLLWLLWVKPGQRLWAEPACSSPSQYPQGCGWRNGPSPGGLRGQGERGHWSCGPSRHPRVGVQSSSWAPCRPPALLSWSTGAS